jgi:hypothetical protein
LAEIKKAREAGKITTEENYKNTTTKNNKNYKNNNTENRMDKIVTRTSPNGAKILPLRALQSGRDAGNHHWALLAQHYYRRTIR